MRDYLEELLDLLTQETEEEAAGVWETQTASLILPKALEAEAPEGALELPEGMAPKGVSSGDGGDRPWLERGPALEPALDLEEIETVPGLDGALDQEAALLDSTEETGRGACLRRGAACHGGGWAGAGRRGSAAEQVRSRRRPVLLQQAQDLERQAGQAQALAQDRRSRSLASALALPSRGTGPFSLSDGGGERRRTKRRRGGLDWAERIRPA